MKQEQTIIPIDVGRLIGSVEQFRNEGYRLAQIGCTKVGDNSFEINYSFDKDYVLQNLRITVTAETEVPSITGMYWGAFVYENEMHDLFGIQVKGINIDFKGTFIKTAIRYPFGVSVAKEEKK
ncbi:NADH-quinone oxidoreductase subunit C [Methanoregula formicica]|uniref:NADH:ubiquinone oxidoreductase 27 kD subunit n=1 Tax=Methanoregula formicica (strain DSM 22288 / NBRC 105244 / SMSP) TaxID=593750 RepID=L0HD53_METFS|nr:NADH-quinone oxidoreductase subunit C [Methanoregula formicica]AGB01238.1 NADH:ubiquinone oxidoreductase 27 kD subunit [Methanoregula formicica SMSP]